MAASEEDRQLNPYPVLGYKVKPRVLDISRGMNFVSLKDQITRGSWVVDVLVNSKAFEPRDSKPEKASDCNLLIVGAGAAGVSAAMRAAESGVRTLLIDRASGALERQMGSQRRVSLSLYDWPAHHWNRVPWPELDKEPVSYTHKRTPLTGTNVVSGTADDLAKHWLLEFANFQSTARSSFLLFKENCELYGNRPISFPWFGWVDYVSVRLRSNVDGEFTVMPRIVLFALGPGRERVRVPDIDDETAKSGKLEFFEGDAFWGKGADLMNVHPLVTKLAKPITSILISGAGDGAVQDFLRCVLDPKFHYLERVIDSLEAVTTGTVGIGIWNRVKQEAMAAEWQTERARQLGAPSDVVYRALQCRIQRVVRAYLKGRASVMNELSQMIRKPMPTIYWVINEKRFFFNKTYALNRFLAILLVECRKMIGLKQHICLGSVDSISKSGPDWEVTWTPPKKGVRRPVPFVVQHAVVRHGVDVTYDENVLRKLLEPDMRFRGVRDAFQRLAQPFKPIA